MEVLLPILMLALFQTVLCLNRKKSNHIAANFITALYKRTPRIEASLQFLYFTAN